MGVYNELKAGWVFTMNLCAISGQNWGGGGLDATQWVFTGHFTVLANSDRVWIGILD